MIYFMLIFYPLFFYPSCTGPVVLVVFDVCFFLVFHSQNLVCNTLGPLRTCHYLCSSSILMVIVVAKEIFEDSGYFCLDHTS